MAGTIKHCVWLARDSAAGDPDSCDVSSLSVFTEKPVRCKAFFGHVKYETQRGGQAWFIGDGIGHAIFGPLCPKPGEIIKVKVSEDKGRIVRARSS
jgi:hypothetical protein